VTRGVYLPAYAITGLTCLFRAAAATGELAMVTVESMAGGELRSWVRRRSMLSGR